MLGPIEILDPATAAGYLGDQDLSFTADLQTATSFAPMHAPRPLKQASVSHAELQRTLERGQDLFLMVGERHPDAATIREAVLVISDPERLERTRSLFQAGHPQAQARLNELIEASL
ncbi:hypothetical protein DFI_18245 (plasmid) [Deinococcus ficus]|uniref:Uncharacterized protein n=2 Tax=Deinococcus ficus TaxID=317577 RepID=A0A221T2L6_9DEIO|nr:hypothetical protein DFI_18245 [Deinococcus ficus]